MDPKTVTAKYCGTQWLQILSDCKSSGLSTKDYCQQHGLSKHAYYYWKRNLREAACNELERREQILPTGWTQLGVDGHTSSSLDLECESSN